LPQEALIRVVHWADGTISIDPGPRGAVPGRGAYICTRPGCVERALKGGLQKMLRFEGPLPAALEEELLERMRREREGNDGEAQGS